MAHLLETHPGKPHPYEGKGDKEYLDICSGLYVELGALAWKKGIGEVTGDEDKYTLDLGSDKDSVRIRFFVRRNGKVFVHLNGGRDSLELHANYAVVWTKKDDHMRVGRRAEKSDLEKYKKEVLDALKKSPKK